MECPECGYSGTFNYQADEEIEGTYSSDDNEHDIEVWITFDTYECPKCGFQFVEVDHETNPVERF